MWLLLEKLFVIDSEYVYIMLVFGIKSGDFDLKMIFIYFSNVVGCKVLCKYLINFKVCDEVRCGVFVFGELLINFFDC